MIIEDFLDYLQFELNRSERTVQSYGDDLRAFQSYFEGLDDHLSWESVDSDVVRGWIELMMDKGNSATSINRRLSALHTFYRFALSRKRVESDPVHMIKGPKRGKPLPQFLKENEMNALLDTAMHGESFYDVRDRTIIMTFYETGIRLSELIGLDDNDVDFQKGELKVTGKRNKQRIIPFGNELASALTIYMKLRDESIGNTSLALFVSNKGCRLNGNQVRYLVQKNLSRVSTLKKRSPHVLRHTFATAMLNHEAGLESLKKLLGHASLSTTEIYTHTTFEQLKRIYSNAHPRA